MNISQKGIDLIKRFEGFSPKPYLCPAGVWTIGYGTTRGVTSATLEVTEAEAEALLRKHVAGFEKQLAHHLPTTLTQNQYDAICSFVYNLGLAAFLGSTLFRVVCTFPEDKKRIRQEFGRWVHAGGEKLDGLVKRRAAEAAMYCGEDVAGGEA